MDHQSKYNVEIALIRHRLLSCSAEANISPSPSMGGKVEFSFSIHTPNTSGTLNLNDPYKISLEIEATGMSNDTNEVAFTASCNMEGDFRLTRCDENGIPTKGNFELWTMSASQLCPLVAQYTTDMVSRLGYKNINVPPFVPSLFSQIKEPRKRTSKKTKK